MSDEEPAGATAPAASERGFRKTFESLAIPEYRLLWFGSFASYAALQMTYVARPWLAYSVSDSAFVLGIVAAFQGIPQLLASPLGGLAADRFSKRVVLHVSTAIMTALASAMALLVFFDVVEIWHLVIIALIHGTIIPFNHPVRQSYIPVLVPRDRLANAVALNASGRNMNQIIGPAIAGVLLAVDPFLAFSVIVGLHLLTILLSIRLPHAAPSSKKRKSFSEDLLYGLKYVWINSRLRTYVSLAVVGLVLGFPYMQLLPVFQAEVLDVGPERLGLMYSALGVGALTASLAVASFSDLVARGYPQFLAGIAFGIALVAFALSPTYWLSVGLLFVTGFTSQSYTTMNSTQMMLAADPEFYGRVASVNMMARSIMPLAVLPMGALVDRFGAPGTVATAGALLAIAIFLIGAFKPELRRAPATSE